MRVLRSAVRLVLFMSVILTGVAILLGRHSANPATPHQAAAPRYRAINGLPFPQEAGELSLQNLETGGTERIRLNPAERVEYATCSPWQDRQGRSHIAGLWKAIEANQVRQIGLSRIAVPGGEILDRVALDAVPGSTPCWFPNLAAKVLYAGWDGQLYTYAFENPPAIPESTDESGARRPVPLVWRNPPPWTNPRQFWEPTWPTDPRLGGRLIISVSFYEVDADQNGRTRTQLWWLKLNEAGTVIEDSGRLITSSEPTDAILEERLANIATTPDGRLVLAYLARRGDDHKLYLRLGEVTIDPATGHPLVHEAEVVELPGSRLASQPTFSADGGWVDSGLNRSEMTAPSGARRCGVLATLARRPESGPKPAPSHTKLSSTAPKAQPLRAGILSRLGHLKIHPGRLKKS